MNEKIKQLWNTQLPGGITTYILLLFGMGFILYMFGFKSFMDGYFANSSVNGTLITNPDMFNTGDPLNIFLSVLQNQSTIFLAGGALVGVLSFLAVRLLFGSGTASTIMGYLIPIIFLIVFLNLFIFPISTMQADLKSFDVAGLPATAGLFAFFNLFLVLAIIDFVRGTQT